LRSRHRGRYIAGLCAAVRIVTPLDQNDVID